MRHDNGSQDRRRRSVLVALAVAGSIAAVGAFVASSRPLAFTSIYYPYPCPFISGGTDFDGDHSENSPLWRPATGEWLDNLGLGLLGPFGTYGDIPVPGDYNHDGKDDLAVWRPSSGTWYVRCSSTMNCASGQIVNQWGTAGDIPVPADYNADGFVDFAVWRPSTGTWYVRSGRDQSDLTFGGQAWGQYGDCPVPGAFNPQGTFQLNVWRPSNGVWYYGRNLNGTGGQAVAFGAYGDIPFGINGGPLIGLGDLVVFRPSTGVWYSHNGSFALVWGQAGDIPLLFPYTFTSNLHVGVWRPTTGVYYDCNSPSGGACGAHSTAASGGPGDVPVSTR